MESFLFFSPLRRLPFGSFESDVNGFPFFSGCLTRKSEKAVLAAVQANMRTRPTRKQRNMTGTEK
jgi:hypothetical protein